MARMAHGSHGSRMNAHGMVSLAQASAALGAAGKPAHHSTLSRYLDRFPEIPNEKRGRVRFVDLGVLLKHRGENILVAEKAAQVGQGADSVETELEPQIHGGALKRQHAVDGFQTKALGDANLRIKELRIAREEREFALEQGELVPAGEVQALLNATIQALLSELERAEAGLAAKFGRDVAAAVRQARKAALQKASDRLAELATKHLADPSAARMPVEEDVALEAAE